MELLILGLGLMVIAGALAVMEGVLLHRAVEEQRRRRGACAACCRQAMSVGRRADRRIEQLERERDALRRECETRERDCLTLEKRLKEKDARIEDLLAGQQRQREHRKDQDKAMDKLARVNKTLLEEREQLRAALDEVCRRQREEAG